jgi:hypothetical protein
LLAAELWLLRNSPGSYGAFAAAGEKRPFGDLDEDEDDVFASKKVLALVSSFFLEIQYKIFSFPLAAAAIRGKFYVSESLPIIPC